MLSEKLDDFLLKQSRKLKTLQFAIQVPNMNFDYSYSSTISQQRFHSASVGKLMTATLIMMAVEQGRLKLDTPVESILGAESLRGLFADSSQPPIVKATIRDLLGHTSGINDYFESKAIDGAQFIDQVTHETDQFWTPEKLLDFTRDRQKPVASPGERFFYSDTGFILLGQIVEQVFDLTFPQALDQMIFKPLAMDQTCLCFYSDAFDPEQLAPLYVNKVDVHLFKSLSCDQLAAVFPPPLAIYFAFWELSKADSCSVCKRSNRWLNLIIASVRECITVWE